MQEQLKSMAGVLPSSSVRLDRHVQHSDRSKLLIVARYNEDVYWVNDSPIPVILYNKGEAIDYLQDNISVVHQDNRGREASAYLQHIVSQYHHLPDWCYFVQGTPHNRTVDDFFGRLSVKYEDSTSLSCEYSPTFPDDSIKALDIQEWHSDYSVRYGLVNPVDPDYCNAARLPVQTLWNTFLSSPMHDPFVFGYGAQWAVPRQRITDRSLSFWQHCLEEVKKTDNRMAGDLYSAWSFEMVWKYLWGDANRYEVTVPSQPKPVGVARTVSTPVVAIRSGCHSCGSRRQRQSMHRALRK